MDRDRLGHLVGLATELGFTMGLSAAGLVVLGLVAGRWLDARLGTGPIATVVLIIAGAVAGQLATYRLVTRTTRRLSQDPQGFLYAEDALAALGLALRALAIIALPSLIGISIGLLVDRWLGTGIAATLLLVLSGLVIGLKGALHLTQMQRWTGKREEDPCPPNED
jgi:F0F1-type ATP synthase assembly protein I